MPTFKKKLFYLNIIKYNDSFITFNNFFLFEYIPVKLYFVSFQTKIQRICHKK